MRAVIAPSPSTGALFSPSSVQEKILQLRSLAVRRLSMMYKPDRRRFAFRLRRDRKEGHVLEGHSDRYTAIVLIGLREHPESAAAEVLGGASREEIVEDLIKAADRAGDLGEVALTLWAARTLGHGDTAKALSRLRSMDPVARPYPTVELSWALTSLVVDGCGETDEALAEKIASRLLLSFEPRSSLFPHWPAGSKFPRMRAHISCFADQVYPIQALACYYQRTGDRQAVSAASSCATRLCAVQGQNGQWWWHYDVRSGQVVERYPVYSVHQDAMAPMALFALGEAAGLDYSAEIGKGMEWLYCRPETKLPLVEPEADVVWRKVARREPLKISRGLQALASALHPRCRVPGLDVLFRPNQIDYECRPYHLGWLLYAWPADAARLAAMSTPGVSSRTDGRSA